MKIKLIQLSLITSLALSLNASNTIDSITNWTKYPLPQEVVSKSRGGLLADKEAMSDGVGSIVVKSINGNSQTLNNEEYNKLLLLNKDKLTDTVGLKELIASGDIVVDSSTLNSINGNGLSNPIGLPADGTSCNDNNPLTTNDIYTNNVCLGTSIVGTSCDDGNSQTNDDKYDANGVCIGTSTDGQPCDDGHSETTGDFIKNGTCVSGLLTSITNKSNIMYKHATYIINSYRFYYGTNANNLFNNVYETYSNHYTQIPYWIEGYGVDTYLNITIQNNFRIWAIISGTSYYNYDAKLMFTNVNTGEIIYTIPETSALPRQYEKWSLWTTNIIPAGTYIVKTYGTSTYRPENKLRMDSEWFIEKVN